MSNTFNFNATNQQNQIGDNNSAEMNVGDQPSVDKVFEPAIKHVEQNDLTWDQVIDEPDEVSTEMVNHFPTPIAFLTAARDQADIEIASEVTMEPEQFEEQKTVWFERIKKIAPTLLKGGCVIGSAVASTYVQKSPIVAGLIAGFEFAQGALE